VEILNHIVSCWKSHRPAFSLPMPEAVSCARATGTELVLRHTGKKPSNTANSFPSPSSGRAPSSPRLSKKGDNIHVTGQLIAAEAATASRWPRRWPRSRHHLRDSCHSRIPHRGQLEIGISGFHQNEIRRNQ